jgi:hypothetical protein
MAYDHLLKPNGYPFHSLPAFRPLFLSSYSLNLCASQ